MSKRTAGICAKCPEPGFRYRGDRWLCEIHHRIDTMQNCARMKGKSIPSTAWLEAQFAALAEIGMKCPHCQRPVVLSGKRGQHNVISLQHDRSGITRLICMLCNQQHDDLPGDTFYEVPLDHKRCPDCERVLPLEMFWLKGNRRFYSYCKDCSHKHSAAYYAKTKEVAS